MHGSQSGGWGLGVPAMIFQNPLSCRWLVAPSGHCCTWLVSQGGAASSNPVVTAGRLFITWKITGVIIHVCTFKEIFLGMPG